MNKPKVKAIVTPPGVAKFANISKPRLNYNKDGDEYSVDLSFAPEVIAPFQQQLEDLAEQAKKDAIAKAKNGREAKLIGDYDIHVPVAEELDKETGDPTGKMILKAKNSASYEKDGEVHKRMLPVFDAKGVVIKTHNIGRGSTLKISVVPNTFVNPAAKKVGVSLWLKAVQVINLIEFGGGSADSFGFGEEEGYVVNEDAAAAEDAVPGSEDF